MINQRLNKLNDIHSINNENLEVAVNSLKPPIFGKIKIILLLKLKNGIKRKLEKS